MIWDVNATHDATIKSWVESANDGTTDFPLQNLPFGIYRRAGETGPGRVGVAIGDRILDLHLSGVGDEHSSLNPLMALGLDAAHALRLALFNALSSGSPEQARCEKALLAMEDCELLLPAAIGGYTDFYASLHHAMNVGRLFRPDNPLLPNYKYVPIAYHGRASSVIAGGQVIRRPSGQTKPASVETPTFGPSKRLDYELELGFFIATGNALGSPVSIQEAGEKVFGYCLLNDWSARDIQAWEYQPLGPFLGKNFATSVSLWVVTSEALAPFRVPAYPRLASDPRPLAYLMDPIDQLRGGLNMKMEVWLQTEKMRAVNMDPVRLSSGNFKDMYWTVAQMVAHHTSNGCNLRTGDLLGSGTVSGEAPPSGGSLLELTQGGSQPLSLPGGEKRTFLESGDEVILRARCEREGFTSIGFGECRGRIA